MTFGGLCDHATPPLLFLLMDKITQLNDNNYFIKMEEMPHLITKNDIIGQIFLFRDTFIFKSLI